MALKKKTIKIALKIFLHHSLASSFKFLPLADSTWESLGMLVYQMCDNFSVENIIFKVLKRIFYWLQTSPGFILKPNQTFNWQDFILCLRKQWARLMRGLRSWCQARRSPRGFLGIFVQLRQGTRVTICTTWWHKIKIHTVIKLSYTKNCLQKSLISMVEKK